MKNIIYCSSMQLDRHESNSRSKFSTSLDINNLNYLSNESLEVAIQSIKLDTSAYNVIESSDGVPDIVLYHKKMQQSDKLNVFNLTEPECKLHLEFFDRNVGVEYKTKSYMFDARKGKGIGGTFIRSFIQDNCTDGFTTITIILSRSKKSYSILQLIFVQKTKMICIIT